MIFKPQKPKGFTKPNPIQLYTMVEDIGNPKKKKKPKILLVWKSTKPKK